MASSTIKGLTVSIGADTTKLGKALKDVEAKSRSLSKELGDINKLLKMDPGNAELLAQKQKVLADAVAETSKKLETLKEAERQVQEQFERGEVTEEQMRALQREIVVTQNRLEGYENAARETSEAMDKLGDNTEEAGDESAETAKHIDDTADAAEGASGSFDSAAVAVGTFMGNLALDALKEAVSLLKEMASDVLQVGMNFEQSMSNVAAISGAAGDDLALLTETAREYGKSTVFSAAEAADALQYMALAGWKTEEMVEGLPGILNLAAASNMDLAEASDIVTDYLTAFGKSADYAEQFADKMAYTMANANTNTEMLGEAYKNCAATAASMGYSIEETTAVLATMSNAGIKGGEAGTALNAIMTRLATDTKSCASILGAYGVQIYDTQGNMQSLSSILEGVSNAWGGLTDQEQASLAKIIAGTNHYSALQTIMSGLSDEMKESGKSFTDYAQALTECDGAASEMAKTMTDNLSGDLKMLNSAYEELGLTIYDSANLPLREAVQIVTNDVLPSLTDIVNGVEGADEKLGEALADLVTSLLKSVVDMLPAVVDVAVNLIAELAKSIVDLLPDVIDAASQIIRSLVDGLMQAWPQVLLALYDALPDVIEAILDLADDILKLLPDMVEQMTAFMPNLIEAIIGALAEGVPMIIKGVVSLLSSLAEIYPQILDAITAAMPEIVDAITEAMPLYMHAIVDMLPEIIDTITSALTTFYPEFYAAAWELLMALGDAIPEIAAVYLTEMDSILSDMLAPVKTWCGNMVGVAFAMGSDFLNSIVTWFQTLPDNAKTWLDTTLTKIKEWAPKAIEAGRSAAEELVESVRKKAEELPGLLLSTGEDLVRGLIEGIQNMSSWLGTKIGEFTKGVLDGINANFDIHSPSGKTAWSGEMLDAGLAQGITDNMQDPISAMEEAAAGILNASMVDPGAIALSAGVTAGTAASQTMTGAADFGGIAGKLDMILKAIERGHVLMIGKDQLIGATASAMDMELGSIRAASARGGVRV